MHAHFARGGAPPIAMGFRVFNDRRRRRAAAASNSIPDSGGNGNGNGTIHGTVTPAGRAPTVPGAPLAPAAGSKAAELRAWKLAMIELARRHKMPQVQ